MTGNNIFEERTEVQNASGKKPIHTASLRLSMRSPYSLTVRLFPQWVAPLNPLHFLHAPSHTIFHVRNLSVCLCLSCALHT